MVEVDQGCHPKFGGEVFKVADFGGYLDWVFCGTGVVKSAQVLCTDVLPSQNPEIGSEDPSSLCS
jgi:hypothetical protein